MTADVEAVMFLDGAVPLKVDLPAPKNEGGRPSDYSNDIAMKLCERIAAGETVRSICKDEAFPSRPTVFRWLAKHEDFREAYAIAMHCRIEDMADECIEIADAAEDDFTLSDSDGGLPKVVPNREHLARTRIRLDERHWYLSKMSPKRFGDKPDDQSLPVPTGEGAREINPKQPVVIENDPLFDAAQAWQRSADDVKEATT